LNLPDIFASIEIPHRQTNKVKILAAVGFPKRRYSIFNVFIVYVIQEGKSETSGLHTSFVLRLYFTRTSKTFEVDEVSIFPLDVMCP
jgi:hypothetical protein